MENVSLDSKRVIQSAGWMWLVYLLLQALSDVAIYARRFGPPVLGYYLVNLIPALIFLGLSYTKLLKERVNAMTGVMVVLISFIPLLINSFFDLKLPQAPLANVEGMVLRQLPVLMIGQVLVAWHYRKRSLVFYTLLLSLFDLGLVVTFNNLDGTRLPAYVFTIIIRTASFLVVGLFINKLITSLFAQQESLKAANQKLAHYASTLENLATSRERNRVSRELHDTVVHTLSGLAVQLETTRAYLNVDNATASRLVDQSLEATRKGLTETRRALKSLRASPLDDLGLCQALAQLAASAAERANLETDISLPEGTCSLPPDVEQTIYRTAQEAVENIVHHANAKRLGLRFSLNHADALLVVEDDGLGFDTRKGVTAGHFGLAGMKERAQLAGGELAITSQPDQGTTVRLFLKGCVQ
jgi:signal transduction histidine kinase